MRSLILVCLLSGLAHATPLQINGTLKWDGQPTSDGSQTWPAMLSINFSPDYQMLHANLVSSVYAGQWMLQQDPMTSANQIFFFSDETDIALTMNPLGELSDTTLEDIESLRFRWAHPDFNEAAPVSWLSIEAPINVPEPTHLLWIGLLTMLIGCSLAYRMR